MQFSLRPSADEVDFLFSLHTTGTRFASLLFFLFFLNVLLGFLSEHFLVHGMMKYSFQVVQRETLQQRPVGKNSSSNKVDWPKEKKKKKIDSDLWGGGGAFATPEESE